MNDTRIIFLFEKLCNGHLSASEESELSQFLADPDNESRFKLLIDDAIAREKGGYRLAPSQRDRILSFIGSQPKPRPLTFSKIILWHAAVACFAFFLLVYAAYLSPDPANHGPHANATYTVLTVSPEFREDIVSIRTKTGKINLDSLPVGQHLKIDDLEVVKIGEDAIQYLSLSNDLSLHHRVTVPVGRRYDVTLTDGSSVSLNACSILTIYPVNNANHRAASLVGEAYFDIQKDQAVTAPPTGLPFTVKVKGQIVKVLGTKFNVAAYADEPVIKTTLVEGRVHFNGILLHPDEQLRFVNRKTTIEKVNTEQAVAWRNGYFTFHNEDIRSIMRQIARWYRIDVSFANGLSNDTFGGVVAKSSNLQDVLDILTELGGMRFSITTAEPAKNERRVLVMP